ncbi:competence protein ComFB [Iocasia frigidifontis]|uniref:Competence protein ComFB n=1 Tax=Iocasia fonsfrigidae TaxID=2682810 RepID=A0A8A7KFZ5_9FIRM|nr:MULTISPECIES: late competence development ComFB family protein [Halanaerobiaceae]AZO93851.1 competence protein ComFB [Halocella sp. SP3-1]QTL96792.1 competence protein ComFB [Iocasia fonsfrigidae]
MEIDFNKIQDRLCNHTEILVLSKMEELLQTSEFKGICTCEQCLLDMASYALNRLPAKYFSCREGELQTRITEFENQIQVDVISIITKAIKAVAKDPRH